MRAMRCAAAMIGILALAGCAVAPPTGPSVMALPAKGKSFAQFQADDASCRQYAAQQIGVAPAEAADRSFLGSAAVGTLLGAAAGAAIGAATGNPAAGAAIGAGGGLALGAASGVGAAEYSGASLQRRYDMAYLQCMAAKGESVPQSLPAAEPAYAYPRPSYPPYAYAYPYPYPYYWYGPPAYFRFGFGFHRFHRH